MSILLDTHYVFALAAAPNRLRASERKFLAEYDEPFRVSAVSIWEIRLKWAAVYKSGQRKGPISAAHALQSLRNQNIVFLPLTNEHAITQLEMPLKHADPFDEILLAQAQCERLQLLSRDMALSGHPLVMRL